MFTKIKRKVLQQFVAELYRLNKRDACWDPIGSIDYDGMKRIIEVIARGKLDKEVKHLAKQQFVIDKDRIKEDDDE